MKEIKISEGVELIQPETTITPESMAEVRRLVTDIGRKMFIERDSSQRRWLTDDFYKPLR